jgi:transcription antitermination factor NusB
MRKRTRAREYSLQILYRIDLTHDKQADAFDSFWEAHQQEEVAAEVKVFTEGMVNGVLVNLSEIDDMIGKHATNWQLKRMAAVDRNILRMSCYELVFCEDIPPKVSINEAVELAKRYSGLEAGKFVNAILDKIKTEKEK